MKEQGKKVKVAGNKNTHSLRNLQRFRCFTHFTRQLVALSNSNGLRFVHI